MYYRLHISIYCKIWILFASFIKKLLLKLNTNGWNVKEQITNMWHKSTTQLQRKAAVQIISQCTEYRFCACSTLWKVQIWLELIEIERSFNRDAGTEELYVLFLCNGSIVFFISTILIDQICYSRRSCGPNQFEGRHTQNLSRNFKTWASVTGNGSSYVLHYTDF